MMRLSFIEWRAGTEIVPKEINVPGEAFAERILDIIMHAMRDNDFVRARVDGSNGHARTYEVTAAGVRRHR
jgi:hypothetical protein